MSERLQQQLRDFGFELRPLDLTELFGKGGGGPHCLVNQLFGIDPETFPDEIRFSRIRDALYLRVEDYPDSA